MPANYTIATPLDVCQWIKDGHVKVYEREGTVVVVSPSGVELTARWQKRKRCTHEGDLRVDVRFRGLRRSVNVSHLVWMSVTQTPVPTGWEIHHIDENPENNTWENLMCVHPMDHIKLHIEVPF